MGLESLQNLHLSFPPFVSSCRNSFRARSCSLSSFISLQNQAFTHSFGRNSTLFGSTSANRQSSGLKRSCSADSYHFFDQEFAKQINDLKRKSNDENENSDSEAYSVVSGICSFSGLTNYVKKKCSDSELYYYSSMSYLPSKLEFLEPILLGIRPEPPEWPELDEIVKMTIQRKANSFDIPLSLRMIGRKQKSEDGFVDSAGDFAYCSVKKAFSSMVFMIRELQSYALVLQGRLYSEDLESVIKKFQKEMNDSFVWLFQQVFSRTPSLMVYVLLLLANFTVHSMVDGIGETPSRELPWNAVSGTIETISEEEINRRRRLLSPGLIPEIIEISGFKEMTDGQELELWNSVEKEASMLKEEARQPVLDKDTMKDLVKSVSIRIEPDDYMEFHRTDLVYQMGVAEDPNNSLLLLNYAQFLYLVRRDYDRAEECFKRAIMCGPDAETFSRYADFLWVARKDLLNAEEVYQQAMEAEPNNHYYASKYANFLWSTGGEDTCFPLTVSCNEVV